jgi:hypothetical protein
LIYKSFFLDKKNSSLSIIYEIKPLIGNSLYSTEPFRKIKGYLLPIVVFFDSKTTVLKEETFGLNLIFNCFSPSNKKASSN